MASDAADKPSLIVRMASRMKGEVPSGTLESFRRAGGVAYGEMHNAELLRRELAAAGADPWAAAPGTGSQLLCAWNAFVLQSIGEHLLDADYAADRWTAGHVPAVTHAQVTACFDRVEAWTSRARQAAGNADLDVNEIVPLPDHLPAWAEADPCPLPHLRGMLAATRAIRGHADVALGVFLHTVGTGHERDADVRRLRQLAADAATAADYAEGLLEADPEPDLHEAIELRLQNALEGYYHLGQLVAMPVLIAGYRNDRLGMTAGRARVRRASRPAPADAGTSDTEQSSPAMPTPLAMPPSRTARGPRGTPTPRSGQATSAVPAEGTLVLPGSPAFDPWCLTSPHLLPRLREDPRALRDVVEFWRVDPDPAKTLRIGAEIDAARADGSIGYAVDARDEPLGAFSICPWSPVYAVHRKVTIAGRRLRPGRRFAFRAHVKGEFLHDLAVGNFVAAKETGRHDLERAVQPREPGDVGKLGVLETMPSRRWSLTAPHVVPKVSEDPAKAGVLDALWDADPDQRYTLRLQERIDAAWEAGRIDYARTRAGARLDPYWRCPWGAVYEVRRPVMIGGRGLDPRQKFVFRVGETEGGKFLKRISIGDFAPAGADGYCELVQHGI
ncbi:hypothetical protein BTM25_20390 [Actinomadura rubteroloni]|uniref:Uncharacterized protein n=1 Tax=Actinomadura rubteroloni TaxID=1926885 RepID=A0A2P4URF3_9ACTN|nr:hypothetical protein [Actinomadura rubteroloni]POM27623.1 hypothetical protein BTM25_20390 [Actinomadura rubteroloni]